MDWLEWSRRLNRKRMESLVALLLAFAVLAERAAGLTGPRRRSMLGILGYAEAEARALVIAMAQECGQPAAAAPSPTHGRAERLAASFRALALMLSAMLALARRFACPGATGPQAGVPTPPRTSAVPAGRPWTAALLAFDTS